MKDLFIYSNKKEIINIFLINIFYLYHFINSSNMYNKMIIKIIEINTSKN